MLQFSFTWRVIYQVIRASCLLLIFKSRKTYYFIYEHYVTSWPYIYLLQRSMIGWWNVFSSILIQNYQYMRSILCATIRKYRKSTYSWVSCGKDSRMWLRCSISLLVRSSSDKFIRGLSAEYKPSFRKLWLISLKEMDQQLFKTSSEEKYFKYDIYNPVTLVLPESCFKLIIEIQSKIGSYCIPTDRRVSNKKFFKDPVLF